MVGSSPFCCILRRRKSDRPIKIHTFGLEEGRGATEIATAIGLMAAAGVERGSLFGVCLRSMDEKQASDNVTPVTMGDTVRELHAKATLNAAILRKQTGGKNRVCFQEMQVSKGGS